MPSGRRTTFEQLALIDLPAPSAGPKPQRGGRQKTQPAPSMDGDLPEFLAGLDALAAELMGDIDPVAAELYGAAFTCMAQHGAGGDEAVGPAILAALAEHPSPAALALVLAVRPTAEGATRQVADAVADHFVAAGVAMPSWADALTEPITAGDFWRMTSPEDDASVLIGSFHRAGSTHVMVISVDGNSCGEASMIGVVELADLAQLDELLPGAPRESIDPAEFRWEVESALRIRREHDDEDGPDPTDEAATEYAASAALLRTRLAVLPRPDRPLREHPGPDPDPPLLPAQPATVKPAGKGKAAPKGKTASQGKTAPKGKPTPKRKPAKQFPTYIYQIKVTLRRSKPPIWRRLEVPADITLYRLHQVLQLAFDWDDMHLHQFVTPAGRFGEPDPYLDRRGDKRTTLFEVAPGVKSRILYEYDFGDSWEHEIVVEKILDRDPDADYPRCTGGRRAAPPEDCGGVWGHARLIDILADPAHPEHEDLVSWMGLDSGDEYDPEAFDAGRINHLLGVRR